MRGSYRTWRNFAFLVPAKHLCTSTLKYKTCQHVHCTVAVPSTWHFKEAEFNSSKSQVNCCFISEEEVEEGEQYKTGLSVRLYKNIPAHAEQPVNVYCGNFLKSLTMSSRRKIHSIQDFFDTQRKYDDFFAVYECEYSERPFDSRGPEYWVYWRLLANLNTGSVFELCFESPLDKYREKWDLANTHIVSTIECDHAV